jgi:hypothetical protein
MIRNVFRNGTLHSGATTEPRADNPPFMADEDGGHESWDDIWRDEVPPISVNEDEEVGEGWDDDVPHTHLKEYNQDKEN